MVGDEGDEEVGLNFDEIDATLGTELPTAFHDFITAFKDTEAETMPFGSVVVDETEAFISLNERVAGESLAGLDEWPAHYILFGDDGCGNFYTLDAASEEPRVLFYNHESDELIVEADSLTEFGRRLAAASCEQAVESNPTKREVVSSGYEKRKQNAAKEPRQVEPLPAEAFSEDWQTDWTCFVQSVLHELGRGLSEEQLTVALNTRFGSRPVWWIGIVEEINLGEYKSVSLTMPECPRLPGWKNYAWGTVHPSLRTEEEDDLSVVRDPSKQILTSLSAWKSVSAGDTIRFQMMIAPVHSDKIPCIARYNHGAGYPLHISVQNTGGHVTEILSTG